MSAHNGNTHLTFHSVRPVTHIEAGVPVETRRTGHQDWSNTSGTHVETTTIWGDREIEEGMEYEYG